MFCSICGSDVHYLCHGRIGVSCKRQICRHSAHPDCRILWSMNRWYWATSRRESSYKVSCLFIPFRLVADRYKTVGAGVPSNIAVGTRVAVEPGVSCRHCTECRAGKYHVCFFVPRVKLVLICFV
jgi:D-xylulose reductase